jgi:hypothetical protein
MLTKLVELSDDIEDPRPCIFESDAVAIRTFVRELVTQSIIPTMERLCAQWNEQVATRRKGVAGRLMSLSKRWAFGSNRNSSSPVSGLPGGSSSSNYDSLQGFYRPDAPEALMRKLGDYAFMLRDFKLAQSTYDLLRSDFDNDKAWKYHAGANEMCAVSALLNTTAHNPKTRPESLDRMLEAATNSYVQRSSAPYYALRALLMGIECLRIKGNGMVDETARWGARILETNLIGPVGQALVMERISGCYALRRSKGVLELGSRKRKRRFWALLAADSWLRQGKAVQAERCLSDAKQPTGTEEDDDSPEWMKVFLQEIQDGIVSIRLETIGLGSPSSQLDVESNTVEVVSETLDSRANRKSVITDGTPNLLATGMDAAPLSPVRTRDKHALEDAQDDGFEQS